ncbi:MAG: carboxypeptidase-like regulatory domain-containing protein [Thermoguttaceae bacterium]|nr:carboxypeptidase-like regulatory domain-containing protein [Thermoguttaceae bacterium]MDW8078167.1 carboxypeptidase-like regulatory domain-containing protein [Thermoguttaceae bacterium]
MISSTRVALATVLVGALLVCTLAGCGGREAVRQMCSVEGTVTYQGKPVTGGFVVFTNLPARVVQSGQLDSEGRYRIPEIPVGDYQVHLGDPPPPAPDEAGAADRPQPLNVPNKYKSASTSGLTAKLSPGKNTCDFTLP